MESLGVGFWGVHFDIGMHIKVLAQLLATLQKSNVLSTLCPLFIGEDSSIVLETRSSSLQDPPTHTLGSSGGVPLKLFGGQLACICLILHSL